MALKFFTVSARDGAGEAELHSFLSNHRIVHIDRRWVDQGENSYWAFCIDYLLSNAGKNLAGGGKAKSATVDYREVLNADDFSQFARLRDFRKQLATSQGVPPYMIFTNEQLAEIVRAKVTTKEALGKVDGLGEARVAKWGDALLAFLNG